MCRVEESMAHLRDIDPLFPELLKAAELDGLVTVKRSAAPCCGGFPSATR